jgi:hypothetical protein
MYPVSRPSEWALVHESPGHNTGLEGKQEPRDTSPSEGKVANDT